MSNDDLDTQWGCDNAQPPLLLIFHFCQFPIVQITPPQKKTPRFLLLVPTPLPHPAEPSIGRTHVVSLGLGECGSTRGDARFFFISFYFLLFFLVFFLPQI